MEEKLLIGLQDAVLQPEAVKYAVEEFVRQIEDANRNASIEIERAREDRVKIQAELTRLADAVASIGHSKILVEAIEQRERLLREIDDQVNRLDSEKLQPRHSDITNFVVSRLSTLRSLVNKDITRARAELLRHVTEIRLVPGLAANGTDYIAVGEWDLLGTLPEIDRARHLSGVRARLVAGVGFEPTTSGL